MGGAGNGEEVDIIYRVLKQAGDLGGRRSAYSSTEREVGAYRDIREMTDRGGVRDNTFRDNTFRGSSSAMSLHRHHSQQSQYPPPPPNGPPHASHSSHHLPPHHPSSSSSSHHRFHRAPSASASLSVNHGPPASSSGISHNIYPLITFAYSRSSSKLLRCILMFQLFV